MRSSEDPSENLPGPDDLPELLSYPPLTDEDFVALADELFVMLDLEEQAAQLDEPND